MKLKVVSASPIICDAQSNSFQHAGHQYKHVRRDLCPCPGLLELPGELFDAGERLQLVGTLLQNRPEVFSAVHLWAVPVSGQTSRIQM